DLHEAKQARNFRARIVVDEEVKIAVGALAAAGARPENEKRRCAILAQSAIVSPQHLDEICLVHRAEYRIICIAWRDIGYAATRGLPRQSRSELSLTARAGSPACNATAATAGVR